MYVKADGFTIVDRDRVLGFREGAVIGDFDVDEIEVRSWGGCRPMWVAGDLVAARFSLGADLDRDETVVPLRVEGGGCVVNGTTEIVTEVVSVEVVQAPGEVEIRVWTRDTGGFRFGCAGVDVELDTEIDLGAPVGDRAIYDTGLIPRHLLAS